MEKQAEYVLRTVEERGIRFMRLWFTDVQGFLKSVSISPAELELAFVEGMTFDGSAIDGYARIQEADMIARPDPSTFQILPWRPETQVASMFCDILTTDGEPFEGDPRWVLKRNLRKAADLGYGFYVGPELEYFYFEDTSPEPQVLDRGGYFDLTPLDVAQEYRRTTINALEQLGIPVEYSHHEVSPSQHEIDLRYTDALTMADNVMTFRLTVKEIALEHGIYATFMPKPLFEDNGSGMSDDVKRKLFSSFFSTKGPKGTGLGLLVTRKLIEEHQGKIEVTSRLKKGTAFTVRLPYWNAGEV